MSDQVPAGGNFCFASSTRASCTQISEDPQNPTWRRTNNRSVCGTLPADIATLRHPHHRNRVDGITDYLKQHWPAIREQLLSGTYEPKPVRRVEIPKPDGGGVRKLGIPTVLDRFIQQAVMQVLQKRWDRTFSEHSYGFRPGRSAHQAVAQAQQYIAEGYSWTVDFDLEKFFDRVNHDKLMGQIAKRVEDKRLLKLIRAFLNAGVRERVGQPERRRDSARRTTFAVAQ
jgi:group II intron reverse transcriptase/maturase